MRASKTSRVHGGFREATGSAGLGISAEPVWPQCTSGDGAFPNLSGLMARAVETLSPYRLQDGSLRRHWPDSAAAIPSRSASLCVRKLKRRRRQAQRIAKAKTEGRYRGGPENAERNKALTKMLKQGLSWSAIIGATGASRSTLSRLRKRQHWS